MKITKSESRRMLYWKDITLPNDHLNIEKLSKQLAYETILHGLALDNIITKCLHVVHNEPNLIYLQDPVIVIGDVHGQFYDLLNILSHCNALKNDLALKTKLVFLGDYVDRGINSMQVMIMLMALKIEYSSNIILLRGNHESRIMTQQYNFRQECCNKYSQSVYESILDVFNALPIACVVNREYFCVHGGISDKISQLAQINTINRYQEITLENDAFCDFIWSDPIDKPNGKVGKRSKHNEERDCSIVYGIELVNEFLMANELTTIIRGHEVFLEGYKTYAWNGSKQPPPVITVFSAPNYCGTCGNKGAVAWIEKNNIKIKQFREQEPEKYKFLVKFDVFSWTLPEILGNVREIAMELLDIMVQMHIPELQSETQENSLAILVKYAYNQKLVEHPKPQETVVNPREAMTAEEERNYLFNRSQEYYANSQKAPKHQ